MKEALQFHRNNQLYFPVLTAIELDPTNVASALKQLDSNGGSMAHLWLTICAGSWNHRIGLVSVHQGLNHLLLGEAGLPNHHYSL